VDADQLEISEALGESAWRAWKCEGGEKLGCGASPRGSGVHEGFDGAGQFVVAIVERRKELGFGDAEGEGCGCAPRGEVGHARGRGQIDGFDAGEGGGDGGAECAEERGAEAFVILCDRGFGAAFRGGDGGHADDQSAIRQAAVGGRLGRGEQDGPGDVRGDGLGSAIEIDAGAARDAAQRFCERPRKISYVIERKHPMRSGERKHSGVRGRQRLKRGGDGIDKGTQQAGSGRLAAAGRSGENEYGCRNAGSHTGEQPRDATQPCSIVGEVEERAQIAERGGRGFSGSRQRQGAARRNSEGREAIGDTPGIGSDLDDVAAIISEIEHDAIGERGDARVDVAARPIAEESGGFEREESVAKCAAARDDAVLAEERCDQPIPKTRRAQRDNLVRFEADGNADAGLTMLRGKGRGSGGVREEQVGLTKGGAGHSFRFL
jgi:hypothetical protein